MNEPTMDQERIWECGWSGHELAQLRRMARMPLAEKLAWLEEAHELVLNLQEGRARAAGIPRNPHISTHLSSGELPEQSERRVRSEGP